MEWIAFLNNYIFLASDEKEGEFEGFNVKEMPLSFCKRASDGKEDASIFLHDESNKGSESEASDEEELVWK